MQTGRQDRPHRRKARCRAYTCLAVCAVLTRFPGLHSAEVVCFPLPHRDGFIHYVLVLQPIHPPVHLARRRGVRGTVPDAQACTSRHDTSRGRSCVTELPCGLPLPVVWSGRPTSRGCKKCVTLAGDTQWMRNTRRKAMATRNSQSVPRTRSTGVVCLRERERENPRLGSDRAWERVRRARRTNTAASTLAVEDLQGACERLRPQLFRLTGHIASYIYAACSRGTWPPGCPVWRCGRSRTLVKCLPHWEPDSDCCSSSPHAPLVPPAVLLRLRQRWLGPAQGGLQVAGASLARCLTIRQRAAATDSGAL
jgi:hypothetical protein